MVQVRSNAVLLCSVVVRSMHFLWFIYRIQSYIFLYLYITGYMVFDLFDDRLVTVMFLVLSPCSMKWLEVELTGLHWKFDLSLGTE